MVKYYSRKFYIIPFLLCVDEGSFHHSVDPHTLRYLSQHGIITIHSSHGHFELLSFLPMLYHAMPPETGTTLKKVLQKSNPFKQQRCGRENCLICKQAGRGQCNAHRVMCQGCGNNYVGETARNAYTRGTEHAGGLENQDEKSALWRHCVEKHGKE